MNPASSAALRVGAGALLALLIVQLAWHAWWTPTSRATLALSVLPLLPPLWLSLYKLRRGVLIGGIVCLFYFCHGIVALRSDAVWRIFAAIEVMLCLVVIATLYWDARFRAEKEQS
jgi:uncharacterized membrane protein